MTSPIQTPPQPDPRTQDTLNRAAAKAAERRFTGEPPTGFGDFA